jgi:hypothetical protein
VTQEHRLLQLVLLQPLFQVPDQIPQGVGVGVGGVAVVAQIKGIGLGKSGQVLAHAHPVLGGGEQTVEDDHVSAPSAELSGMQFHESLRSFVAGDILPREEVPTTPPRIYRYGLGESKAGTYWWERGNRFP